MSLLTTPLTQTMVDDNSTSPLYLSEQRPQIETLTSPTNTDTLKKPTESSSNFYNDNINTTPTSTKSQRSLSKANSIDNLCSETEDHLDEDIEDTHYRRRKLQIKSEIEQDLGSECDSEPEIEWHLILESMDKKKLEKEKTEAAKRTPPNGTPPQVKFPIEFSRREPKRPAAPPPRPNLFQNCPPPPNTMMNPFNFSHFQNPYFYPYYGRSQVLPPSPFGYASPSNVIPNASSPAESLKAKMEARSSKSKKDGSINKKRNYSELEKKSQDELANVTVYVSNISKDLNTMDFLTKMFKKFGNLVDLKIYQEQNKAQVSYSKQEEAVKAFNIIGRLKGSLFGSQDIEASCPAAAKLEKPSVDEKITRNEKGNLRQTVQEKLTKKLQNLIANKKEDSNFEENLKMIKLLLSNLKNEPCDLEQFKDQLKIFEIEI